MSWSLIARKEVGDSIRSRQLFVFAGLFVLIFGLAGYATVRSARRGGSPGEFVDLLTLISMILVPVAGLSLAHEAIVKRRTNGQWRLMLGLPHSRRDLVVGTYLGRYAILAVSVLVGTAVASLFVLVSGFSLPWRALASFLALTLVLALVYVAIGITVSALVRSTTLTAFLAFGSFLLFVFAWWIVPDAVVYLVNGLEMPASSPWWTPYLEALSPSAAHERVSDAVTTGDAGGDVPLWFATLVLAGWAVIAPGVGYLRFRETDL
ncbi:ABC transporter permease [Halobacteria archaeon AArc-m2/3/4]|uniref:ABC transporter permease n=1 Tax=Natronoglomus mannanivorans TaxID=2979990 RepID=A0AAP2Z2K0_9EURY|nr:ABC transporter permease [Halobacteria archaeon AArc-xg1-1]MCU4975541.1 ABC transporter permease [Halobacteria archaeon AArc-m2/3/4]